MSNTSLTNKKQFRLGRIVATPAALAALERAPQTALHFLALHSALDPGCLNAEDQQTNEEAVEHEGDAEQQGRVFSAFMTTANEKLWVITEADRSSTCILLPEDY